LLYVDHKLANQECFTVLLSILRLVGSEFDLLHINMSEFLLPLLDQKDQPLFVVVIWVADVFDANWQQVQEMQYFATPLHPTLVLMRVQWGLGVGGGCFGD
jgi:hypothetical protein